MVLQPVAELVLDLYADERGLALGKLELKSAYVASELVVRGLVVLALRILRSLHGLLLGVEVLVDVIAEKVNRV